MPTLTWLDSFYHQQQGATFYGTNAGIYDTSNRSAGLSAVTGRRPEAFALQVVEDGVTATRVGKTIAAGNRTLVESFYFKVSATPSVDSNFWQAIATINGQIGISATTGTVFYTSGSGVVKTVAGNWADGAWHRVDVKFVTSATPYTLDLFIDGVSQTQHVSNATTAADITESRLGSNTATHTLTVQITDWVRSVTSGDYPIGAHRCLALIPNADGTHSWTSTHMGTEAGLVASSATNLFQSVDEWPANLTDYIQAGTSTTSGEYAEVAMLDAWPSETVWAARSVAAIFSAGTAANSATTRVVDAANATKLDLYVGDQSDTSLRHQATMIPSVTDATTLNGLKWRVGFPTDSNPQPEWSALLIDYAVPDQFPTSLVTPRARPS